MRFEEPLPHNDTFDDAGAPRSTYFLDENGNRDKYSRMYREKERASILRKRAEKHETPTGKRPRATGVFEQAGKIAKYRRTREISNIEETIARRLCNERRQSPKEARELVRYDALMEKEIRENPYKPREPFDLEKIMRRILFQD